jgi:heat shock protein HslJ
MALVSLGLTILLAALSFSGAQSTASPTPSTGLEGTAWRAVDLAGMPVPAQPSAGDREPHLIFGTNGRVTGADGCNRLTGPYAVKGNGVTFGQLAGTQMFCANTEEIVRRFLGALKGTSHWSIVAGRLEFYGATGKPLAVFERRPPAP